MARGLRKGFRLAAVSIMCLWVFLRVFLGRSRAVLRVCVYVCVCRGYGGVSVITGRARQYEAVDLGPRS